mmetsp:Transcript_27193/g.48077  ORF Transcript_27193/g.48077 Transcript_27193/m.48077 type:complete len:394 (+) Transcript_27193:78-1259(+)
MVFNNVEPDEVSAGLLLQTFMHNNMNQTASEFLLNVTRIGMSVESDTLFDTLISLKNPEYINEFMSTVRASSAFNRSSDVAAADVAGEAEIEEDRADFEIYKKTAVRIACQCRDILLGIDGMGINSTSVYEASLPEEDDSLAMARLTDIVDKTKRPETAQPEIESKIGGAEAGAVNGTDMGSSVSMEEVGSDEVAAAEQQFQNTAFDEGEEDPTRPLLYHTHANTTQSTTSLPFSPQENPNPTVFKSLNQHYNYTKAEAHLKQGKKLDSGVVYALIRNITDPEHPLTLEQLGVVRPEHVDVYTTDTNHTRVKVQVTPTVPHCSVASLIGLSVILQLKRKLWSGVKLHVQLAAGSHDSEESINKQLLDKERIEAALENPDLLRAVEASLPTSSY